MAIIMNDKKKKIFEFSKKILLVELIVLSILIVCAVKNPTFDGWGGIVCAWIANIGLSTTAYYWKARTENRVKIPVAVIESLPQEMLDKINLTEVITAIVQSE